MQVADVKMSLWITPETALQGRSDGAPDRAGAATGIATPRLLLCFAPRRENAGRGPKGVRHVHTPDFLVGQEASHSRVQELWTSVIGVDDDTARGVRESRPWQSRSSCRHPFLTRRRSCNPVRGLPQYLLVMRATRSDSCQSSGAFIPHLHWFRRRNRGSSSARLFFPVLGRRRRVYCAAQEGRRSCLSPPRREGCCRCPRSRNHTRGVRGGGHNPLIEHQILCW
jgi:hypothetical protein